MSNKILITCPWCASTFQYTSYLSNSFTTSCPKCGKRINVNVTNHQVKSITKG